MKVRVGYTCCMVIDFLGVGFDERHIVEELQADVEKIVEDSGFSMQTDWDLRFDANFTNAREVLVSKNRVGSYPSDSTKQITIVIPVPYIEVVPWGVKREQHTYDIDHFDKLMRNFSAIGVNYAAFSNRTDYIMDSMRRGIRHSFHEGFTVNKVKVKLNSDQTRLLSR
jgi:Immunity protein 9